jgi:predicted nucleic acid-binding protein
LSLVIDSSVSLAWCFEDERSDAADAVLKRLVAEGAHAPVLWPSEVLNVLVLAERRSRITGDQRQRLVTLLRELPITLDAETMARAWTETAELAARLRLTVYDATYLELAHRLGLPLATLDQDLRAAAATLGVELLGQPGDGVSG